MVELEKDKRFKRSYHYEYKSLLEDHCQCKFSFFVEVDLGVTTEVETSLDTDTKDVGSKVVTDLYRIRTRRRYPDTPKGVVEFRTGVVNDAFRD